MKIFLNIIRPIIDTIRCLESGHRLSSSKQFLSLSKSLFALALLLLSSSKVAAAPITPKQAQQRATTFFRQRLGKNAAPLQLSLALAKPSAPGDLPLDLGRLPEQESPASASYYIYNKVGGGYVIVSGDDGQQPIIGYSDRGHIVADSMPENMRWWLDGFYRTAKQEAADTSYPDPIDPMLTSEWGQNAPYNQQTPLIDGKHAPAGCGAVALAQIIRYQQWPDSVGNIPKINNCEKLQPTGFDWDKLLDTYDGTSPADCQDEVAKLMRYTGQALMTFYGQSSSTIRPSVVPDACHSVLRFNESHGCYRKDYDDTLWNNLIYNSLEKGDPVFYGGNRAEGSGHAFVLDGYSDGYFHINWGWTGSYDGYFLLSDLSPNSSSPYSYSQYAILALHKPASPAPIDTVFMPSKIIQVKDMLYNPVQSADGCLSRETVQDNFRGLVIEEERSFTKGKQDVTILYGLALYDQDQMIDLLADTLLDLSNLATRKKKIAFQLSLGADIAEGEYQIRSVSRSNQYNPWMPNADSEQNFIHAHITANQLNLSYSQPTADGVFFSVLTGFDSDDKFVTIDDTGTPSSNLKIACGCNGGSSSHYFDYGISLCKEDNILQAKSLLQQTPVNKATTFSTEFSFDATDLPDGLYFLRGVYRECGSDNWNLSAVENDDRPKLIKQGNHIYREITDTMSCSSNNIELYVKNSTTWFILSNPSTDTFDAKASYFINRNSHGFYDYGLALYSADSLRSILCSHYGIQGKGNGFSSNDSIHIPANLPPGEYTIKAIGRDANTSLWNDITSENRFLYVIRKNDSLYVSKPEEYNIRFVRVDSIMFLNNNSLGLFLTNTQAEPVNCKINIAFTAKNKKTAGSDLRVKMNGNATANYDLQVRDFACDTVTYICRPYNCENLMTIAQGLVIPLQLNMSIQDFTIGNLETDDALTDSLFDEFRYSYVATTSTTAHRANLTARVVSEKKGVLLVSDMMFNGNSKDVSRDVSLSDNYWLNYQDIIGSNGHVEIGYTRFYNDTLICFTSKDFVFAPYVNMQTYQDNQLYSRKYLPKEPWTTPENALFVAFDNAALPEGNSTIVPNANPNTAYLFDRKQKIPQSLADCWTISDKYFVCNDFNIVDSFPVSDIILPSTAKFQMHIGHQEWFLLGCPFYFRTEDLAQFDDVMTIDRLEGNTLYFKKLNLNDDTWVHYGEILLVRGNEKTVSFSNRGIPVYMNDYECEWGNIKAVKRNIPCHYDNMYLLAPDGSHFYRTEGDVLPYRCVLQLEAGEMPELIRVVIEGYQPTTVIGDMNESQQVKARHTLDGRAVGSNYRGIIIETYANGATRKVVRR